MFNSRLKTAQTKNHNLDNDYNQLYLKYKKKYLNLKQKKLHGGTNGYVNFINISDPTSCETKSNGELKIEFKNDLEKYSGRDPISARLLSILNTEMGKLILHIFVNKTIDCYLLMIQLSNDKTGIRLGKQYNFPRGFPIIWKPNEILNMYGFYPKFENDKRESEDSFNRKELDDGIELNFNFKYSGYLGQVVPFTIGDKNYWTTCGKNYTNYIFSESIRDLMMSQMTTELLNKLCSEQLHICGETLSRFDQTHGAAVKREGLIVTLVGKGHWIYNRDSEPLSVKGSLRNFIETFSQLDMHTFCVENGLFVDSIYKVKSYDTLLKFMMALNSVRNITTYRSFIEFWQSCSEQEPDNYIIKKGNVIHDDFLGDILEGLIIKITKRNPKTEEILYHTIKYKFPYYTARTFFLRDYLQAMKIDGTKSVDSHSFLEKSLEYITKWVINVNDQRHYWRFLLANLFINFDRYNAAYYEYIKTFRIDSPKFYYYKINKKSEASTKGAAAEEVDTEETESDIPKLFIGPHIFIMDQLMGEPKFLYDRKRDYLAEYNSLIDTFISDGTLSMSEKPLFDFSTESSMTVHDSQSTQTLNSIPVILTIGPIGGGKSTTSSILEEKNPDKFKHIDGDILDIGEELVKTLGQERNDYTKYKIFESIYNGKIPIVSMGGGQILNRNGEITLSDDLNESYKNKISVVPIIILPVMPDSTVKTLEDDVLEDFIGEFNKSTGPHYEMINDLYTKSEKRFQETYTQRTGKADYSAAEYKSWYKKNVDNFKVLCNIITSHGHGIDIKKIILTPLIETTFYQEKIHEIKQLLSDRVLPEISLDLINETDKSIVPFFSQKRLLVDYQLYGKTNVHHVTLRFKPPSIVIDEFHNRLERMRGVPSILMVCPEARVVADLEDLNNLIGDILDHKYDEIINTLKQKDEIMAGIRTLQPQIREILDNIALIERLDIKNFLKLGSLNKYHSETELYQKIESLKNSLVLGKIKRIKFIIFDRGIFEFDEMLRTKAHITVDPGVHKPENMATAATIVYESKGNIRLKHKDSSEIIEYVHGEGIKMPCNFHTVFYIK